MATKRKAAKKAKGKRRGRQVARYTEEFRASALGLVGANGGDVELTAKQLRMSRTTLQGWWAGRVAPPPDELRHEKRRDLTEGLKDMLDALTWGIASRVRAGTASLKEMSVAMGIGFDKLQLLEGQPTAHTRTDAGVVLDWSKLSPRQVEYVADALDKAAGTLPAGYVVPDDPPPPEEPAPPEDARDGQEDQQA